MAHLESFLLPDMPLGKYRIIRKLGEGLTSEVYLAHDPFKNRDVAIKIMFPDVLKDMEGGAQYRMMFLAEASLAGKIIHPHIVSIYDAVVQDDMSYIVMEYLEGGTLEKYTAVDNLLKVHDVVELAFKCARALAFAHVEGLIHRDIKPGNILLQANGVDIKIGDFGAAIRVSSKQTSTLVGSPLYMAPELASGGKASMQSDIYALGVVMYQLLTGHPPYEAGSRESLEYQITNHDPKPLVSHKPDLSPALIAIVNQAMAKELDARFANWESFGQALAAWSEVEKQPESADSNVSDAELFSQLKRLNFFQGFRENELWEVLRLTRSRSFPAETLLIQEGDVGDSFFIILRGSVKVTRGKRLLNVLGTGDCFGEMSYLAKRSGPRSATITTASDCTVIKIRAHDLNAASNNCRRLFDRRFLSTLIERLETANQLLAVT
jgi:eukaryotic-like serine/threonine-protein kinase